MNKLLIAAAGSGKTTYLIRKALKIRDSNVLITTYTEANAAEIKQKFVAQNGRVPGNITIQTWFSFLLQHCVRPYQSAMHNDLTEKTIGFYLTDKQSGLKYLNGSGIPIYWGEQDFFQYYFTRQYQIYSDKIARFIIECNKKTYGEVINRVSRIFPYIFIDEVQDLAGWELEIIKLFFKSSSEVLLVGDPRQVTYLTHHPKKYEKYSNGNIAEYITNECPKDICEIDTTTLNRTHRNNQEICNFSSLLFPTFQPSEPCDCEVCRRNTGGPEGVFLVKPEEVSDYLQRHPSIILRERDAKHPEWNFGKSKGMTFDRVIIYPTKPIEKWLKDNTSGLAPASRCKFYVAITRARYSVAIVIDYKQGEYVGIQKWEPILM